MSIMFNQIYKNVYVDVCVCMSVPLYVCMCVCILLSDAVLKYDTIFFVKLRNIGGISYHDSLYISVNVVWHDVLLLHGEYVQGEPVYVQQLPENDGPLQPCRIPPQGFRLSEGSLQYPLVNWIGLIFVSSFKINKRQTLSKCSLKIWNLQGHISSRNIRSATLYFIDVMNLKKNWKNVYEIDLLFVLKM